MKPETQYFFSGCKNPVNVSNVIVALASGNVMKAERLPVEVLPHVVLLATIGLRSYNQQIIDDYEILLRRAGEVMTSSDVTRRTEAGEQWGWLPGLFLVNSIIQFGPRGEYDLDQLGDASYMFTVYEDLINGDTEKLFKGIGEQTPVYTDAEDEESAPQARPNGKASHNGAQRRKTAQAGRRAGVSAKHGRPKNRG